MIEMRYRLANHQYPGNKGFLINELGYSFWIDVSPRQSDAYGGNIPKTWGKQRIAGYYKD